MAKAVQKASAPKQRHEGGDASDESGNDEDDDDDGSTCEGDFVHQQKSLSRVLSDGASSVKRSLVFPLIPAPECKTAAMAMWRSVAKVARFVRNQCRELLNVREGTVIYTADCAPMKPDASCVVKTTLRDWLYW